MKHTVWHRITVLAWKDFILWLVDLRTCRTTPLVRYTLSTDDPVGVVVIMRLYLHFSYLWLQSPIPQPATVRSCHSSAARVTLASDSWKDRFQTMSAGSQLWPLSNASALSRNCGLRQEPLVISAIDVDVVLRQYFRKYIPHFLRGKIPRRPWRYL